MKYRRRRKSSFKRKAKRIFRAKRRISRIRRSLPAARHSVILPFRFRTEFILQPGYQSNSLSFARFAETGQVSNVYGYDSSPMAEKLKGWDQFAVMGMKIVYTPSNLRGTSQAAISGVVQPIQMWNDPNDYNIINWTEGQKLCSPTYKEFDPTRRFKMYFGNKSLANSMDVQWANTNVTNPFYTMADNRAHGTVAFKLTTRSETTSQVQFGDFLVTWYVRVRGIKKI